MLQATSSSIETSTHTTSPSLTHTIPFDPLAYTGQGRGIGPRYNKRCAFWFVSVVQNFSGSVCSCSRNLQRKIRSRDVISTSHMKHATARDAHDAQKTWPQLNASGSKSSSKQMAHSWLLLLLDLVGFTFLDSLLANWRARKPRAHRVRRFAARMH